CEQPTAAETPNNAPKKAIRSFAVRERTIRCCLDSLDLVKWCFGRAMNMRLTNTPPRSSRPFELNRSLVSARQLTSPIMYQLEQKSADMQQISHLTQWSNLSLSSLLGR